MPLATYVVITYFLTICVSPKRYIIPIDYSYSTQLKGKCLSVHHSFRPSCFPVDTEGKFCYDGIYSNIENRLLTEMYSPESCEKGEPPPCERNGLSI